MWNSIVLVSSLLLLCHLTHQSPQNGDVPDSNNAGNEPIRTNCTKARKADGFCVERQFCDYGTAAIDKTLYAPKGYKRPCKLHEVCCPLGSITRQPDPNQRNEETKELNFDDYDANSDD